MPSGFKFCWTLNNYTQEELAALQNVGERIPGSHLQYMIFGRETAPETGTPHLQGYCRFSKRLAFQAIKLLFRTDRVHLEVARGTEEENIAYCAKGNDFLEYGIRDPHA